jgi:ABC-type uncharacterized transport system permease subunit
MSRFETHWYWTDDKTVIHGTQTFVLTPTMKVAVDPSVEQPPINLTYVIQINKFIWINYVSSHVVNYQHVSSVFAIIIGVALQEYKEYNNLPHWISETIQCYNKCLKP